MRDTPDGGRPGAARPDLEPTINEAGASGFVVDGTDSFAVPGPVEEISDPTEDVPVPAVSRTRVLVTVGAVVAGLLFVIAVGSGGGSGSAEDRLRTQAQDGGSSFTLPGWGGDDAVSVVPRPVGPLDDETLRMLEDRGLTEDAFLEESGTSFDDEFGEFDDFDSLPDITYDDFVDDLDDFDDFDDFDPFDDDDFPTYRPVVTPPRRSVVPTPRRPVLPVLPDDDTTVPTPADDTTTTAAPTTTTTIQPTTTLPAPPPPPAWQAAAAGLPDCPATLRLWSAGDRLIASAGGLFTTTDPKQGWSRLGADVAAVRDVRAFVGGPNASTFWIGSADGVFATADGGATHIELGDLTDVRSLGVAPSGPAAGAFAVTAGGVVKWDVAGGTWVAVAGLPSGEPGHVVVADDGAVVLGTTAGVLRSTDAGQTWAAVSTTPVVGPALRAGSSYAWLAAGGAGVLRSGDGGASWTRYPASGQVADDATAFALSAGEIVAPGDGLARLIRSTDGGTTWTDVQPAPPYRVTGLANLGPALVGVTTDCAAGVPGGSDSVVVLTR